MRLVGSCAAAAMAAWSQPGGQAGAQAGTTAGRNAMSTRDASREQMCPSLSELRIASAQRFASSERQHFAPGEMLFEIGARDNAAWLVTGGSMELVRRSPLGDEVPLATLGRGLLSGEVA